MEELQNKNKYLHVDKKQRKDIIIDNLLGGISWGVGSVIGATIVVGILGLIFVNTKKVPILGDVVKIISQQIKSGVDEIKNN